METPNTLLEAVRHFSDLQVCHAYMVALKWPDGPRCPKCGGTNIGSIATRRLLKCRRPCKKQFSAKTDTIFEDSPLGVHGLLERGDKTAEMLADLASKLVRVPKREVIRAEKRYERRKQKRRKQVDRRSSPGCKQSSSARHSKILAGDARRR